MTEVGKGESDAKHFISYLYLLMERYVEELRRQAVGGVVKYIKLGNLTDGKHRTI